MRHIVFGTGQVDRPLAEPFAAAGHDVVAVDRGGGGTRPGVSVVSGDAADTTREVVDRVYELAGRPRLIAARSLTPRAIGIIKPPMREHLHTLYELTDPWFVDDSNYRARLGDRATSLDEALTTTLAWYATQTPESAHCLSTFATRSTS